MIQRILVKQDSMPSTLMVAAGIRGERKALIKENEEHNEWREIMGSRANLNL